MNPVRAGLCAHPRDWAFGSYPRTRRSARRRGRTSSPDLTRRTSSPAARTTFAAAIDAAVALRAGRQAAARGDPARRSNGSPQEHVRHARQVYGYTVPEIAAHYRRSARSIGAMAR